SDIYGNSVSMDYTINLLLPPEIMVYGIENATTYSEVVLITVTITHNQPLSSIMLWVDQEATRILIFHSDDNLTLINVSSTSWTFSVSLDTTTMRNGDYSIGIEVIDSQGIGNITIFFISIENIATTTTTDLPSSSTMPTTSPTTTKTTITSISTTEPIISPGFPYLILLITLIPVVIIRRKSK
ncbi:MAG: hypothetical protein ACXAC8_17800, partial [Candidatus Hodarchaeales archaeon]